MSEKCLARSQSGNYCNRNKGHVGKHIYYDTWEEPLIKQCGAEIINEIGYFICSQKEGHSGDHAYITGNGTKLWAAWPQENKWKKLAESLEEYTRILEAKIRATAYADRDEVNLFIKIEKLRMAVKE